ncbi:hypothetical protein CC86DRAFT_416741 [Ophiobolus disseminans]|uniref:Uncharacterized protein n=1 Tax=Ophiobolus disseminans TaxID=1469910 RepID=A0A6A7A123_9PLEO|nr:hypothetical protein CC86DRAFT_416741 [Ophiobolus disseminans]
MDMLCGSHVMEKLYKDSIFSPENVSSQESSPFITALPTEVRLAIYDFVFSPPYEKSANILPILAIYRKVHSEAIIKTLESTQFHLDGCSGLKFQSKLRVLGDFQQHLRRIDITMPIQKLDAEGGSNPFALTKLPFTSLIIDFENIEHADNWLRENCIYHRFMSALLHTTAPNATGSGTVALHNSIIKKEKRRYNAAFLKPWATKKQLFYMVVCMKTKNLIVKCVDDGKDILCGAFAHFVLFDDSLTILRA